MIIYIQISQKIHVKLILKLPDFWNVGIIVIKEMRESNIKLDRKWDKKYIILI